MFLTDDEKASVKSDALDHIASGKSLKSFTDARNLSYSMVWNIIADEDNSITRARDIGTHVLADECIQIADEKGVDPAEKRIRIDTRLRLIGKWNRKDYGDKVQAEVSGKDGDPIKTVTEIVLVAKNED